MRLIRRTFLARLACAAAGALGLLFGFPATAAAAGARYWRGHNCPNCGRLVLRIYSFRSDGLHYHRCGQTFWFH